MAVSVKELEEAFMNDTLATQTPEFVRIRRVIEEYDALIEKAALCVSIDREEFARLTITETNHIGVRWPEVEGGYYDSYSMETQTATIEPTLFVKSVAEIEAINMAETLRQLEEERRRREARDEAVRKKAAQEREFAEAMAMSNERAERAVLARLKAKYEGGA